MVLSEPSYRHFGCPTCRATFRGDSPRCPMDGAVLTEQEDDPLVGTELAGRYIIEKCVGEGGMGRVYRARHNRMSRPFAIKVLFGDLAADPKMRQRFEREAEAASRLSHPNVISVVDFGETPEHLLYLVMDYIEGRELARIIAEEAPLESPRIRRMLVQMCQGLAHAHDKGLIHRDFKGENVIVTGAGIEETARIVDFGIAMMMEPATGDRLTSVGIVMGTPAYMSPEQALGEELDARADLFSLGVVLYEMLAGVLPFSGPPLVMVRKNLTAEPPLIHERVPGLHVDGYLENVARTLMAKAPQSRYQNARVVLAGLDDAAAVERSDTMPMKQHTAGQAMRTMSDGTELLARSMPPRAEILARGMPPEAEILARQDQPASTSRRRTLLMVLAALLIMAVSTLVLTSLRSGTSKSASSTSPASPDTIGTAQPVVIDTSDAGPADVEAPDARQAIATMQLDAGPHTASRRDGSSGANGSNGSSRANGSNRSSGSDSKSRSGGAKSSSRAGRPTSSSSPAGAEPAAPDQDPEAEAPTSSRLAKLYYQTGNDIEQLRVERGNAVIAPMLSRFRAIHLSDSQRTLELRAEAYRTLSAIQADIQRERKRASK